MVTIMDTETTSAPRTESISACTTVGTVVISVVHTTVAHTTALPASQVITTVLAESAPVAVETSQDAGITATAEVAASTDVVTATVEAVTLMDAIMATVEAVTLMDAIMATVEAATSTVIAQGAPHATKAM
jgi:hypothetical protein